MKENEEFECNKPEWLKQWVKLGLSTASIPEEITKYSPKAKEKMKEPINTVDNVSLEISFGLESKDKKKIDECINFSFIDGNGNDIFTSLTKEQLLYKITKDIDNN